MIKILLIILTIIMIAPIVSANYTPGDIVEKQVSHFQGETSIDPSWVKSGAGSYLNHLSTNDGDTTTVTQTNDGGWMQLTELIFINHNWQNPKLSIDIFLILKTSNVNKHLYVRFADSGSQIGMINRIILTDQMAYTNYTISLYWNPASNTNWTYDDFNAVTILLYSYGTGDTVLTEIGSVLTITQEPASFQEIFIYLIGMLIILGINLVGFFKIPFLSYMGIIGTLILTVPTVLAFNGYEMLAIILILINIGLPVLGLAGKKKG